jgi:hypothetical protein
MLRIVFSTPWERTTMLLCGKMKEDLQKHIDHPEKCKYKDLPSVLAAGGATVTMDGLNPKRFFIEVIDPQTIEDVKKEMKSRITQMGLGALRPYMVSVKLEEI